MELELLDPQQDRAAVAAVWRALAEVSPHSYFLSWGFVETWLDSLPRGTDLRLAVLRERGAATAAAACLGRALDQLYIEDNGLLLDPRANLTLTDLAERLPGNWEELYLSGIDPRSATGAMLDGVRPPYQVLIANRIPAPYVDLAATRNKDYLALVSANTRAQIRRCYKLYGERGPVRREVAEDAASALEIYGELVELHQGWWRRRGGRGAFASPYFDAFHRSLIARR